MNAYLSIMLFLLFIYTLRYSRYIYLNAVLASVYFIMSVFYLVADYFTDEGVNEAVIYHLQVGLEGAGFGAYKTLILITVLAIVCYIALTLLYIKKFPPYIKENKKLALSGIIFITAAFILHPLTKDLYRIYSDITFKSSNDFQHYYKTEASAQKGNGLNVVYIYAESLERTYMDENLFPGLIRHLKKLQKQSDAFTDINQVINTGWTIAGVVATQCGIPLFVNSEGNTVNANSMGGSGSFLRNAVCLGDILKKHGYYLVEMQGSSIEFSGIKEFYKTHSFDEIHGKNDLEKNLKDKTYLNGWGLYDDSLLKQVYAKFLSLSESGKKFALFFATMDTHHPDGQLSKTCSDNLYKDGKNSILNCVKCSDRLLSRFIDKIRHSKYAKNTLIVITSDHLAMRNDAYSTLLKGNRKDLFLIFDPKEKKFKQINRPGSMLDVGSTVLYKLGIDEDIGLGRNLYKEDSLYTKFKNFDRKLLSWGKNIFGLWGFANIQNSKTYTVYPQKGYALIAKERFNLPVLIKIDKNANIKPIFEFNSPKQLYSQLKSFKKQDKFIWIDKCSRINYVFDKHYKNKYCLAQGFMSGPFNVYGLEKPTQLTLDVFKKHPDYKRVWTYDILQWKLSVLEHMKFITGMGFYISVPSLNYHTSPEDGIDFGKMYYPDYIKAVAGLENPKNGGRWNNSRLSKNIIFIFNKKLPENFTLKLKLSVKPSNTGKTLYIKTDGKTEKAVLKENGNYSVNFRNVNADIIEFIPADFDKTQPEQIKFEYMKIIKQKTGK